MESTLSSRTNPSHSTFTAKWDQVWSSFEKKKASVSRALGMDHWAKQANKQEADINRFCKSVAECVDWLIMSFTLYAIIPFSGVGLNVCVLLNIFLINSEGGGSAVIQRRVDGSVEFDQSWNRYELGFGDLQSKCSPSVHYT